MIKKLFLQLMGRIRWCIYCGDRPATLESSRTAYAWNGKGKDPNSSRWLCAPCAKAHHEHWDAMWQEYHSGLL